MITDQGQGSSGSLRVVVYGHPEAILFKDRRYGQLRADICGECGHVEIWIANAAELYDHYRTALEERE